MDAEIDREREPEIEHSVREYRQEARQMLDEVQLVQNQRDQQCQLVIYVQSTRRLGGIQLCTYCLQILQAPRSAPSAHQENTRQQQVEIQRKLSVCFHNIVFLKNSATLKFETKTNLELFGFCLRTVFVCLDPKYHTLLWRSISVLKFWRAQKFWRKALSILDFS